MSSLTYSGRDLASADAAAVAPRRSFWRRVYQRIAESQQRRAEREIARYLATHGGLLNDEIEREMMRRLTGNSSRPL